MDKTQLINIAGAVLFALAVLHTFSTKRFQHLAHTSERHAGLWHLLGEVEVVFGFWALVLVCFMAFVLNKTEAITYLESRNFTEPLFVFVILTVAGTRPILFSVQSLVDKLADFLPISTTLTKYFLCLSVVPLLGSFITEPAAMTLAALMLRDGFFVQGISERLKYATLGVLFVNVSIGGVLTNYAAPPVLMVADTWDWNMLHMLTFFGWKAALAVTINAFIVALIFRNELTQLSPKAAPATAKMPFTVIGIHYVFLAATVLFSHHPVVFLGLFLFFLGFTQAYQQYQDKLMLREGLLVAFFLAGLVVLGGKQQWWLQPIIAGLDTTVLFVGAIGLTAITDNAALTYLGSLVQGMPEAAKYALVAGAVTGGGLTVIANAPNPAGYAILKDCFDEQSISPLGLFLAAFVPTIIAALCFWFL
ncbi:MAG: putative Na+/H+ antiporter [Burkholderiaceae bacterium]|nr:putative Na+/H+ antiporter [Burkholderiaceae bacterium]